MNKLKLSQIIKTILPVFFVFIFWQCMHDEFDFNKLSTEAEINSGLLMPLAYGSLSFDDIISSFDNSGFLEEDADGLLYLTYADSLISFIAEDLLEIPEQDFFQFFIQTDFAFPPGWDTVMVNKKQNFPFSFANNEKLDSMILETGNLIFDISSEFQHTGQIVMTFPNITLNGTPLVKTVDVDDPSGNFSASVNEPIDGYTIHLNDSSGVDSMFLPVEFHVELYYESGNPDPAPTDSIKVVAKISALEFESIFGYIGDYEMLSEAGEMDLGFFDSPVDGYIEFEEPIINLNIQNSYGVPAAMTLKQFKGFNNNGDSIALTFGSEDTLAFEYAFPRLSDYFNSDILKDTTISINNGNSNLPEFLAFMPSVMEYNMSAKSNPDGNVEYNFVTNESEINVGFEFILPLYFKADSFALMDTIDFNLFEDADFVEKITIKLDVSNGLPLDIDFQIIFTDSLYNPIDSLFEANFQPVIESASLNDDDSVKDPGIKTSLIEFTGTDIENLESVKFGLLRAGLKTPDDDDGNLIPVKFYSNYAVDFSISVGIEVKANTNDF
ncbi:MAG: hypothetical protein KOO66_04430 [Bacteroidales bacterium]|nr:hypothetical protein [Bacteroidales bacterium]